VTCPASYEVEGQRRRCDLRLQHTGAASGVHWDQDAGKVWCEPILPVVVGSTTDASEPTSLDATVRP
jgi:uncharacterized membrane protein